MPIRTAVILAGGLGTRLRKAVPNLPKPMAPINGRPFLECQLDYWINQGIENFILSVGYLSDVIINHFGESYKGASIKYVVEQTPLGTGGGLLLAASSLNEPFLALNGDTFVEVNLEEMYKFHQNRRSLWTFALFKADDCARYMAIQLDSNGKILSLNYVSKEKEWLSNGGVYIINPKVFLMIRQMPGEAASLEEDLLPSIVNAQAEVYGIECSGAFIDIGIPEDYYRSMDVIFG